MLERSGGFAGITRTVRVARADVPPELTASLDRALAAPTAPVARGTSGGADRFSYLLRHNGRQTRFHEGDLDPETRRLVSWLMAHA